MNAQRIGQVILMAMFAVVTACGPALAAPAVVFYDDFEDNDVSDWDIAPCYRSEVSITMYDPGYPDAHDGQVWGKGSGYAEPVHTWMVQPVEFDGSGALALEVVGHSGTSWPNQAGICLLADSWPREGYVYEGEGQYNGEIVGARPEGYTFTIWGEANQWVQLEKHYYDGETRKEELVFRWGHNVVSDQTYRLERNAAGQWSLEYGDADGSNMQPADIGNASDLTFTSFGHVGVQMLRDQSAVDYIQVEAEPIPEPATLGLLVLGGIGGVLRRRRS